MLWVGEFREIVHFFIINWFNQSGAWIWDMFRVRFNWNLWSVNLNVTIINCMVIKSLHDSWNHSTSFGRRGCRLKWASGGWMFHSLGVSVGLSTWKALNWSIFILRLGGRNLGTRMIQASALCPILPHHLQIIFCLIWRAAITGLRVALSLLVED